MNADARWTWIFTLALLLIGSGCASTSARDDWTSSPNAMQREAYGVWVDVRFGDAAAPDTLRGELITATEDSLFLIPPQSSLRAVARSTINELQLTAYDANWSTLGVWIALGTLSTISHGFFLILSAPVWIIGGSAAASRQSYRPIYTNPPLETLRRFARFPQGLPPDLERNQLRPKPLPGSMLRP